MLMHSYQCPLQLSLNFVSTGFRCFCSLQIQKIYLYRANFTLWINVCCMSIRINVFQFRKILSIECRVYMLNQTTQESCGRSFFTSRHMQCMHFYQGYKTGMAKLSFAYGRNMTLVYLFNFDFLFILHIHKFVLKKNEENFQIYSLQIYRFHRNISGRKRFIHQQLTKMIIIEL